MLKLKLKLKAGSRIWESR